MLAWVDQVDDEGRAHGKTQESVQKAVQGKPDNHQHKKLAVEAVPDVQEERAIVREAENDSAKWARVQNVFADKDPVQEKSALHHTMKYGILYYVFII